MVATDIFKRSYKVTISRGSLAVYINPADFDFSILKGLKYYCTGELFNEKDNSVSVMVLHFTYRDFILWSLDTLPVSYEESKAKRL